LGNPAPEGIPINGKPFFQASPASLNISCSSNFHSMSIGQMQRKTAPARMMNMTRLRCCNGRDINTYLRE
jgi:hypothetical protein